MIGLEAWCPRCRETFCPLNEQDLKHVETLGGKPCGGRGQLRGSWGRA